MEDSEIVKAKLDMFEAEVGAICKLTQAYVEYQKAAAEVHKMQIQNAASAARLQQLRDAIKDFENDDHAMRQKIRLTENRIKVTTRAARCASHLLTGTLMADRRAMAIRGLVQLIGLASTRCLVQCGQMMMESGESVLKHFTTSKEVPEIGSDAWMWLSKLIELLAGDAQERADGLTVKADAIRAKLEAMQKLRWDQVAEVGIKW